MKEASPLEKGLALLYRYGTLLASVVVAAGLILRVGHGFESPVTVGIGIFILLPVIRLIVMSIAFLKERELRLSATAALVVLIIGAGVLVGLIHRAPQAEEPRATESSHRMSP